MLARGWNFDVRLVADVKPFHDAQLVQAERVLWEWGFPIYKLYGI